MVRVVVAEHAGHWNWWVQVDLPTGCDVLVRGAQARPDPVACRAAAGRLADVDRPRALSVQDSDGRWHLRFCDTDGNWIAVSADRYPDARTSRHQLGRLLQAMGDMGGAGGTGQ